MEGMLSHPWEHDVDASKRDQSREFNDLFQMTGLPFTVLISPDGEILVRSHWDAFHEVEKLFAK